MHSWGKCDRVKNKKAGSLISVRFGAGLGGDSNVAGGPLVYYWYPRVEPTAITLKVREQRRRCLPKQNYKKAVFTDYLPNSMAITVFLGLESEISPLRQTHPSQPPAISCVSRPHVYRLSPYLIPAQFLTINVYSRLGLPILRMIPYHSAPPTPR